MDLRHPAPDAVDRALIAAVQQGLPLTHRPYAELAARLDLDEAEVIGRLRRLLAEGAIKRLGVVVRHRELGYRANAMVVWDVPDERVDALGRRLGALDCVTLCYRRPRRPPAWPYNLFTMIHGLDRPRVLRCLDGIIDELHLASIDHAVLFSGRRFKQRGACYAPAAAGERPA